MNTQPGGVCPGLNDLKNGVGMRKLKGYIGALIVVMSLMGSILAGYALNITGTSAVINEFEKVTDVSGLYAHTDEKNYIEYNPASNYTGYSSQASYYNAPVPDRYYKSIQNGTVDILTKLGVPGHILYINGVEIGNINNIPFPWYVFACDYFYIYYENQNALTFYGGLVTIGVTSAHIVINDNVISLTLNGSPDTAIYPVNKLAVVYSPNNYDYSLGMADWGSATLYANNEYQFLQTTTDPFGVGTGNSWVNFSDNITSTQDLVRTVSIEGYNVSRYLVGFNGGSSPIVSPSLKVWGFFYPIYIQSDPYNGVDYDRSNRVNNYPFEYEHSDTSSITTNTIDLQNTSVGNYWDNNRWWFGQSGINTGGYPITIDGVEIVGIDVNVYGAQVATYKLSDILNTIVLPSGTTNISFDTGNTYGTVKAQLGDGTYTLYQTFPTNMVRIANVPGTVTDDLLDTKRNYGGEKAYYSVAAGLVDVYDYDGVKLFTSSLDNTYIQIFKKNPVNNALRWEGVTYEGGQGREGNGTWFFEPDRPNPFLNLTITTNGSIDNTYYMDISKGIAIKPSVQSVTWNNEYENGDIKLVFRAERTDLNYFNTFTVSGNNIAINYTNQHYYVSLNGGEAVDIGMWRSIVLDIDLIDGRLTAIPVRTFNSFSNVQLDSARINIGELVNAVPSASIAWGSTSNSLRFGVYSTEVFMDTYGVVMVNPTLNITNYFTDLNNFYRLKLFNFSVLGDSITINGVEGTVTGDSVTFGDDIYLKLKEMNVTYADGRVSVQDSHASIDLGTIVNNVISMNGVWYFQTDLLKGFTTQKMIYEWDWNGFIFDNIQFVVFYMGLALAGLIIGRRYATMTVIDYVVWGISMIVAISVQVIG